MQPIAGEAVVEIGADHPALAGHFPGQPVVPGVVLLDEALFAIARARGLAARRLQLGAVKFLHPVVPPSTLTIRHQRKDSGAIEFSIDDGSRVVASGRIDSVEA